MRVFQPSFSHITIYKRVVRDNIGIKSFFFHFLQKRIHLINILTLAYDMSQYIKSKRVTTNTDSPHLFINPPTLINPIQLQKPIQKKVNRNNFRYKTKLNHLPKRNKPVTNQTRF
ncbi:hypothetical protein HanRHA438_Chr17g0794301 [Helianthus annuus]|nr:hypothetical protein HanRHA438_Chr17g0794301 [Helianthus annuus]